MKRFLVYSFLFLSALMICEIYDFVPEDYDLVLLFKDVSENYQSLKTLPIGSFIFNSEGIGMEYIASEILEDVEKECGVSKDVMLTAFSSDVMLAAKGLKLDFKSLTSLDVNYYIDTLKNLGANTILVVKTSRPDDFMRFLATLLGLKLDRDETFYVLKDDLVAIFAKEHAGYVIISGGKGSIESAIATFSKRGGFVEKNEDAKELLREPAFIVGYFKGDSFKIDMGINVEQSTSDLKTEKFELLGNITEGKLVITVKQFVEGNLDKVREYLSSSEGMGDIPFSGNYFFGASVKGSKEVLDLIMSWFSGKSEELDRMASIIGTVLENSKDKAYIVGDVVAASSVTFSAVFTLRDGEEDIEKVLVSNGAHREEDQWEMLVGNGKIYFFEYGGRFVLSNLNREEYARVFKKRKLADDPAYTYMSSVFPKEDISRGFVDVGDILKKLVGLEVSSKMIFYQTYEDGVFLYRLEVM